MALMARLKGFDKSVAFRKLPLSIWAVVDCDLTFQDVSKKRCIVQMPWRTLSRLHCYNRNRHLSRAVWIGKGLTNSCCARFEEHIERRIRIRGRF